jgi:hypothetical protein
MPNLSNPERRYANPDELVDIADLIQLKRVPKLLPERVHVSGPFRWRDPGIFGVQLRAVKVPGVGWCTTRAWLVAFINAVTAARTKAERPSATHRRSRRSDSFKRRGGRER